MGTFEREGRKNRITARESCGGSREAMGMSRDSQGTGTYGVWTSWLRSLQAEETDCAKI